jgi:alpha-tubulin suppressor-like RCC1 family protein
MKLPPHDARPGSAPGWQDGADSAVNRKIMNSKRALVLAFGTVPVICVLLLLLRRPDGPFPPAVQVSIAQSNAPLRVFPGPNGAFFVLPDGSLWRWGQPGGSQFSRARMPEQVGTNTDWTEARASNSHCLGLRRDGTLWEWGLRGTRLVATPEQVDAGTDWTGVAAGDAHAVALKRDGTVWAWGENGSRQLGDNGPSRTNLTQVGTETNWVAVSCGQGPLTCALKRDGTFWVWGTDLFSGTVFTQPCQALAGTNWAGFESDGITRVRNRRGELWQPVSLRAGTAQNASAAGYLLSTNTADGRFAQAWCDKAMAFEVRADGCLWQALVTYRRSEGSIPFERIPGRWRRVGKRSDWMGVWGTGTAIGLTADGTLWIWGADPGLEPTMVLSSRLRALQHRVASRLGTAPGNLTTLSRPGYRKTPTPLMTIRIAGGRQE